MGAWTDFKQALSMAERLIQIEVATFTDPPPPKDILTVTGLRGGAAVLMVAAFEDFVRDMLLETLQVLASDPMPVGFERLPPKMQEHNIFEGLRFATEGPRYERLLGGTRGGRRARIAQIRQTCTVIGAGKLTLEAFSEPQGNPDAQRLRDMFGSLGVLAQIGRQDVFAHAKTWFDRHWGSVTSGSFTEDKLNEIVLRRHRVVHRADALTISRVDLQESIRFLRALGFALLVEARFHVNWIMANS